MKLQTDSKFKISDENLLFRSMGLSKTTQEEMKQLFKPKLYNYIVNNEDLISKLEEDT